MYSIVIIDDAQIIRTAICNYIKEMHSEFHIAGVFSNGTDALTYIRNHPVNIVITDIVMPGMDGLALAEYIHKNIPGIIVMLISSYSEFEYAKKAINFGVSTYLLKPLDFAELSQNLGDARKKLDFLHDEMDCHEEDIQMFFTDLISGKLTDNKEMLQQFSRLSLEGTASDYKGCLLSISLEKEKTLTRWKYGLENLVTALLNSIRMSLTTFQCFYLFRNRMRYFFIILSTQEIPELSLKDISSVLYEILGLTCELQIHSEFSNIEELTSHFPAKNEAVLHTKELPSASSDDMVIQKVISYIQNHYAEDLTREDVADAVYLSYSYFSRFFKQKMGVSFSDYLTSVRMQKAVELLNTRMKAGDIARKVGYQSLNRFFINFRQYSGYTPTEYRRQVLGMEEDSKNAEEEI